MPQSFLCKIMAVVRYMAHNIHNAMSDHMFCCKVAPSELMRVKALTAHVEGIISPFGVPPNPTANGIAEHSKSKLAPLLLCPHCAPE